MLDLDETKNRPHYTELPRALLVGHDVLDEVPGVMKKLNISGEAVLVCDEMTKKLAGNKVAQVAGDHGLRCHMIEIVEAGGDEAQRVMDLAKDKSANVVIGVGGGRPIDVAKYSAYEIETPFISIPTAASHDGIVSGRASLHIKGQKKSIAARAPLGVIADTHIISKSPHRLLASGCADVISNVSAIMDWELAHRLKNEYFSHYAATISLTTAKMMMENAHYIRPMLEASARFVVKALISSGISMAIAGSSRPASGSEHAFSHCLDQLAEKPALHGEQCGVGTILATYLHGGDWENVREALSAVGAPIDARGLGLKNEEIIRALTTAHTIRPERYTILGDGIDTEAAWEVAKITGVVDSE